MSNPGSSVVVLGLPETLNLECEQSRLVRSVGISEYARRSLYLLGSMSRVGIRSSAQLVTAEGFVPFPPLADTPEPLDVHRRILLDGKSADYASSLTDRGITMEVRIRQSLRLANFIIAHAEQQYANINYQDKKYTFIW